MKNIPVNRWTVGIAVLLMTFFGSDIIEPFMKAVGILTNPYVPAI